MVGSASPLRQKFWETATAFRILPNVTANLLQVSVRLLSRLTRPVLRSPLP